ncbi:MAG TPA: PilZ domain-containing protein [Ramlibacter sp.]|nr:PilZ domain-containing protein [Ramlibacter sp.]
MSGDGLTIPVPLQTGDERRRAERIRAAMPVSVEGREGTTLDLSATGLSFQADHPYELGTRVEVVIEYLLDGHNYPLRCFAEVVRSEARDGGYMIGAKLAPQSEVEEIAVGDLSAGSLTRGHLRPVD